MFLLTLTYALAIMASLFLGNFIKYGKAFDAGLSLFFVLLILINVGSMIVSAIDDKKKES